MSKSKDRYLVGHRDPRNCLYGIEVVKGVNSYVDAFKSLKAAKRFKDKRMASLKSACIFKVIVVKEKNSCTEK